MSYKKNTYTDNPNQPRRNPFVIPPSANGLEGSTSDLFKERKFYRDDVFNEFILGNDNLIDYWNNENFYGRINKKGMPIICNENSLKAITSAQEGSNPLALNFVADAFDDMSNSFARLRQQGGSSTVSDESIFYPLEAINGWLSARDDYAEYVSGIFDGFVNGYLRIDVEANRKVVDFSTFLNAFYIDFKVSIFFLISPSFSLNIVVPETNMFAPAVITSFELEKFIPPSTSISNFKFLSFFI